MQKLDWSNLQRTKKQKKMNTIKSLTYALIAGTLTASLSYAQDTAQSIQQGGKPDTETPWSERESLFMADAAEKYATDSGLTPSLTWTGEAWADGFPREKYPHPLRLAFNAWLGAGFVENHQKRGFGQNRFSAFYYTQSSDGQPRRFGLFARLFQQYRGGRNGESF